jgi:acyl-CoA reductase-like NAD-dependent aldehyde dehydrogenase
MTSLAHFEKVAKAIETDACDITMPFGGLEQCGFGRDRSLHALYKYADLKSVSIAIRWRRLP